MGAISSIFTCFSGELCFLLPHSKSLPTLQVSCFSLTMGLSVSKLLSGLFGKKEMRKWHFNLSPSGHDRAGPCRVTGFGSARARAHNSPRGSIRPCDISTGAVELSL